MRRRRRQCSAVFAEACLDACSTPPSSFCILGGLGVRRSLRQCPAVFEEACLDACSIVLYTSAWLRSHPLHVGNSVLIPLRPGKKQPLVSHKLPGQWDWSTFDAFVKENPLHSDWGILLDRIVICIRSNNLCRQVDKEDAKAAVACARMEDGHHHHRGGCESHRVMCDNGQ